MKHLFLKSDRARKTASDAAAIVATVVLFVSSAAFAETYYFVGGDTPPTFATASNWATESGERPASDPDITAAGGHTFVFTNAQDVTFAKGIKVSAHIVKRGGGAVKEEGSFLFLEDSTLTLEGGDFGHWSGNQTLSWNEGFTIEVKGLDAKRFYLYGDGNNKSHLSLVTYNYEESAEAVNTMTFYWFGSSAKTNTFKGAANSVTRFSAEMGYQPNFAKTATFDWNPDYPSAVLEIVGRVYDRSYGIIRVSNGTARFTEGAGVTRLASMDVASGATLEITEGAASDTFGCPVTIEEGGTLKISRGAFKPTSLAYNGAALADGRYSRDSGCDWIEGDGILVIGELPDEPATVTATWTGNGGNTLLTNDANWEGGSAPNLTDGSTVATFPTGIEASVPDGATVAFKGIVVSSSPFTISGGSGSVMKLGSEGVTVTGAAFTNACPTVVTRSQTWDVAADCTNVWAAEVSGDWPTVDTLTLTNNGVFVIRASNPKLCNVNYYSTIEARADVPLGGRMVTAEHKVSGKVVECHGNIFSNNFKSVCNGSNNWNWHLLRIQSGTNVFCGKVESAEEYGQYWRFANSNTSGMIDESVSATFKGGYLQNNGYNKSSTHFSPYANGIVNIEEVPLDIVRMFVGYPRYYRQIVNLNVASNKTTRGIHILRNSTLNTTVAGALYATEDGQSGVLLNDGATWNLSADQGVNVFGGITNTATVVSGNGATFHLRDDRLNTVCTFETSAITTDSDVCQVSLTTSKVQTNKVVFAGNVNFSKEGVLDHWMEGASTSTGRISVSNGRLIFTTGSWRNASGVNVSGDGVIEIHNGNAFRKDTPFVITGESTDGKIVIPSGVSVKVASLSVNGRQINGVVESGLVTGGGRLIAGKGGFCIIFR